MTTSKSPHTEHTPQDSQNSKKAKLKFVNTGDEFELPNDSPIIEASQEAGVPFGCENGLCGTCCITILKGAQNLSDPNEQETDFFGSGNTKERLACQVRIKCGEVEATF